MLNGSAVNQPAMSLPINGQAAFPAPMLPTSIIPGPASEPVGQPSECLLLKNMFDPATEVCDLFFLCTISFLIVFGSDVNLPYSIEVFELYFRRNQILTLTLKRMWKKNVQSMAV